MMPVFCFLYQVESGLVYRDGVPDVYWKVVRSLHPVVDFHGPDSEAAKEAKQILQDVINVVKKAYVHAYKNRVSGITDLGWTYGPYNCSYFSTSWGVQAKFSV